MNSAKLTPTLIALDAVLALALVALWLAPGAPARWRAWQAPAPQAPALDDARAARLVPNPALRRDYPAITARPLFTANRRPHAVASDATAAPVPDSIAQAKLYGLVGGRTPGVLLEHDGQTQFVRRGEQVGDWTLQAIDGRDALFVKASGERRTVTLPDSLAGAGGGVSTTATPTVDAAPSSGESITGSVTLPDSTSTVALPSSGAPANTRSAPGGTPVPPSAMPAPRPVAPETLSGNTTQPQGAPRASFGGSVNRQRPSAPAPTSTSDAGSNPAR
jgi:hypothetical protein